jgi:DNA-binding LacI/PurR family transcriptional regulator
MTIKEIAEKLGLSRSTVSICLAGREGDPRFCIRPEKAQMIREFARKNGYVPNLAARRLRSRSMEPPIGLLFSRRTGIEKSLPAMREAMDILEAHDREYVTVGYKERKISDSLALLKSMNVQNVIIFGTFVEPCPIHHADTGMIRDAESERRVNEWYQDWNICRKLSPDLTLYATDYRFPAPADGGRENMYRLGINHQEMMIEILTKIKEAGKGPVAVSRWIGIEHSLVPELIEDESLILEVCFDGNRFEEGRRQGRKLLELRRKHPFRTVFFGNDFLAAGIMTEFLEQGIRIPEDIGVIGFGNDEAAEYFRVPLSSVKCGVWDHTREIVEAAMGIRELSETIVFPYELVCRESFKL